MQDIPPSYTVVCRPHRLHGFFLAERHSIPPAGFNCKPMNTRLRSIIVPCISALIRVCVAQDVPAPPVGEGPPVVINRDPERSSSIPPTLPNVVGGPQVIGEGGGAKLLSYRSNSRPGMHVPIRSYIFVVSAKDRYFVLLGSSRSNTGDVIARMNSNGDVAIPTSEGLRVFFAPEYELVTILKLRTNQFLKAKPDFKWFRIDDVSWDEGMIVCSGHLNLPGKRTRWNLQTIEYPFLSRLFFDAKGEVRDHQILWTSWHPGRSLRDRQSNGQDQDPAANSIAGSLHVQGGLLLWKNAGHQDGTPYPAGSPRGFEKTAWRCTDIATGATRELAGTDKIDRARLEQIERERLRP